MCNSPEFEHQEFGTTYNFYVVLLEDPHWVWKEEAWEAEALYCSDTENYPENGNEAFVNTIFFSVNYKNDSLLQRLFK